MFFICSCIFYLYLCLFICICIFFICICICICIVFVVWQQQQWILAGITDWWTDSACSEGGFRCRVTIYYSQTPLDTNLLSTTISLAYHHCSHKIIIYFGHLQNAGVLDIFPVYNISSSSLSHFKILSSLSLRYFPPISTAETTAADQIDLKIWNFTLSCFHIVNQLGQA